LRGRWKAIDSFVWKWFGKQKRTNGRYVGETGRIRMMRMIACLPEIFNLVEDGICLIHLSDWSAITPFGNLGGKNAKGTYGLYTEYKQLYNEFSNITFYNRNNLISFSPFHMDIRDKNS
jgi:hypothetical protein